MKIPYLYFTCFAFILISFSGFAQNGNDYHLLLKNGSFTPERNVLPNTDEVNLRTSSFNSKSFVIIQFEKIPDEEERTQLKNAGITLLDYIPNYAYTATVTGSLNTKVLSANKARAVISLSAEQKMQPGLAHGKFPAHATKTTGTIDVWISFPRSFSFEEIQIGLKSENFTIISDLYKNYQVVSLRIPVTRLKELAQLPFVQYVQAIPQEDSPVNNKSTTNSRANVLSSALPSGRNLHGEGVVVGVGDNANPLQHIDFNGRMINRTAVTDGSHGVHVMGTVGGAGIINELYAGYAPKANIIAQNYSSIFAFAPAYVKDYGMVITNNSYGGDVNNCETFGVYDLYSSILDQQAFQMPYLQHVFAAGNSGSTACSPYPTGFANILSGYQTAKNIISVGNTTETGLIAPSSSRGPVKDGRIKPEITAQGTSVFSTIPTNNYGLATGTSMASPAVSGGLALLYQRYRQLHLNNNPKNALMKALLCNSGTDKGIDGPDYKYGFGWMNLLRSLKMIEDSTYKNDSVSHLASKVVTINVPANTAQLKVMLYWNDPAAAILSSQNLVNDLDLTVTNPSSVVTLPKLLDPTPLNVNNPATTGVDHVNNIEQVVIDNPAAGTYSITVKGTAVVQNPRQEYFVVYDIIPVSTTLTYPIGNEHLKDGDAIYINWDSFGNSGNTFNVQYSLNNGTSWTNIGTNLAAATRQLSWTIPAATVTDKARIKVIRNGTGVESTSEVFTILGVPTVSLSTTQCEGYIAINWTAVTGATDYEVMLLKGDEMVSVNSTNSNSYTISNLSKDSTYWVSVRARLNGNPGRRAIAISRKPDSGNCAGTISDNDLKMEEILFPLVSGRKNTSTEFTSPQPIKIRIRNLDNVSSAGTFTVGYSINGVSSTPQSVTPVIAGGGIFEYTFSGTENFSVVNNYEVKVFLNKADDPVQANNTLIRTFRQLDNDVITLPFSDNLETLAEQTYTTNQTGFTGGNRYDFSTDSDAGRIRTFVNSGMAFSGNRAFTLDANRYYPAGVTNYLYGTFNLSAYHVATDDVRLDFRFKNHGQLNNTNNKVWIRGKDTDSWIEAYDLFAGQNPVEQGYKFTPSIELSNLLSTNGKDLSSSFQVRWGQWGQIITADNTSGAGYSFDDIKLYKVTDDIQILSIINPALENCGLSNAESISVTVRNSSAGIITNIPVTYQLPNGTLVTETIPSVAARTNINYIFTAKANLSAFGDQSVKVWTALSTDSYRLNDTLQVEFYNAPIISSFPYLQNFESGDGSWHSGGKNNSWQYGSPVSALISTAASGNKAWKTNLSGSYNDNEESYLYSPCFTVSGLSAPTLSFSLALDFEMCDPAACDIAYVEYSGNGGAWTRLGASGQGTSWYNKTYDGNGSWSIQDYTRWHAATIPLPTGFTNLKLRFVMKSDPFVQREGIAIDDIHIYDSVNGIYDETSTLTPVTQSIPNGTNWVNFTKNGKLIASVNSNNQNMGTTDVQAFINTGTVRNTNEQFYLDRNITIKPANASLVNPATVRIYFLDSEVEALINATGCSSCAMPSSAYELGVSKYSNTTNRTKEDGEFANSTGGNWSFISTADVIKVPFDKGYYAEIKVKDFSEFWFSKNLLGTAEALPVKLISFSAKRETVNDISNDVLLEWATSSEENFDHFEIEVVVGNDDYRLNRFVKIGEISGKGGGLSNQQYVFIDTENDKSGVRYYRLKMIDLDGSYAYSRVRPVIFADKTEWHVYPNPSAGIFNIVYQANAGQEVNVKVYDLNGRLYLESKLKANGFLQKYQVNLSASGFSSGLYLLEVNTGLEKQTFKVIKN